LKRYLEIIKIHFDDIWQKYSKTSRIEFACFSCRVLSTFCLSNRAPKITRILTLKAYQANAPSLIFFKHMPKLTIFGTHNLQTFKRNTLINKLLLMQF